MALDINLNAMLDELEYTIQQSQNDPDLIYDENIYGGVDLSTIDPCRNHYNDEYTKKPVNFKTESNIDNEIIYSPKCQKPYKNDFDPNMTKIQEFLTLAEDYFVKNGIEDIFPRGLNDDQKIIMLFYNLFKQLLVHTIEIMYLTAKNMGLSIPESIYDILKICRFSYHGSLELYDDIGDHTKFHPYFYEHVLKSSLNIICTTKMASDSESFLVAIKIFMAARYHKIKLCGRIINRLFLAISICSHLEMLGILLDYAVKSEISPTVLTSAFLYFINFPYIYDEIFTFIISHIDVSFIRNNHTLLINKLLIVLSEIRSLALTDEILIYMIDNDIPISIEALDAIFLNISDEKLEKGLEIAMSMIDLSVTVPFGGGAFSIALWRYFTQLLEILETVKALSLLPLLMRTDSSLPNKDVLIAFYNQVCTLGLEDSFMCRIRGFIQHFDIL